MSETTNKGLRSSTLRRAVVACVVATIGFATASLACECVTVGEGPVDPASQMRADLATEPAIFVGIVKSIEDVSSPPGFTEGQSIALQRRVAFDVEESWKGVRHRHLSVITGTGAGDCGYQFEVGVRYLVVATSAHLYPEAEPQVGICSNTMPADKSAEFVRALRWLATSKKFARRRSAA